MITDDKLAELDAAEKAATPGDWAVCEKYDSNAIELAGICSGEYLMRAKAKVDINFIALARNHLRELLDEVKYHRADIIKRGTESIFNENEMLRAQLVAARGAMSGFTAFCIPECPCVFHAAIKCIDDTLGDG